MCRSKIKLIALSAIAAMLSTGSCSAEIVKLKVTNKTNVLLEVVAEIPKRLDKEYQIKPGESQLVDVETNPEANWGISFLSEGYVFEGWKAPALIHEYGKHLSVVNVRAIGGGGASTKLKLIEETDK